MSPITNDDFISFSLNLMPFMLSCCLPTLPETYSKMFNKSDPHVWEKLSMFSVK